MRAAVVTSFDAAPRYEEFPAPAPAGDDEMVIDVIAAGLHPRVRSQADGLHYTSTGELPLVPGIDGVGRTADGRCSTTSSSPTPRWARWPSRPSSTPAAASCCPTAADPVAVAAAMNPAMSSWVALRQRSLPGRAERSRPGRRPATPASWRSRSRAPRRRPGRRGRTRRGRLAGLAALGATATVCSTGTPPGRPAAGPGPRMPTSSSTTCGASPTADAMAPSSAGTDDGQPLTWLQIGSVAGARLDPLRRATRRAPADRRQRAGLGQHPRHPRRAARPRPGDHRGSFVDARARPAGRRRGRPGPTPPALPSASTWCTIGHLGLSR